jgi:hypothetical protein
MKRRREKKRRGREAELFVCVLVKTRVRQAEAGPERKSPG